MTTDQYRQRMPEAVRTDLEAKAERYRRYGYYDKDCPVQGYSCPPTRSMAEDMIRRRAEVEQAADSMRVEECGQLRRTPR